MEGRLQGHAWRSLWARQRGFTLVELLVVVVVVAILAAIAIPTFAGNKSTANTAAVQAQVATVTSSIETLLADLPPKGSLLTGTSDEGALSIAARAGALRQTVAAPDGVKWAVSGSPSRYCIATWSETNSQYTAAAPLLFDSTTGKTLPPGSSCAVGNPTTSSVGSTSSGELRLPADWGKVNGPVTVKTLTGTTNNIYRAGDYEFKIPSGGFNNRIAFWVDASVPAGVRVAIIGGQTNVPATTSAIHVNADGVEFVHLEGISATGGNDGIRIQNTRPGSIIQIQNVRIGPSVTNGGDGADGVQTWTGPSILRINRLEIESNGQGFELQPTVSGGTFGNGNHFGRWSVTNVWVKLNPSAGGVAGEAFYSRHDAATRKPHITTGGLYVTDTNTTPKPNVSLNSPGVWDSVVYGTPPGGTVFTATPGSGYVPPAP